MFRKTDKRTNVVTIASRYSPVLLHCKSLLGLRGTAKDTVIWDTTNSNRLKWATRYEFFMMMPVGEDRQPT